LVHACPNKDFIAVTPAVMSFLHLYFHLAADSVAKLESAMNVDEFVKWHGAVPAAYKYLGEKLLPVFNPSKLLTLCLRFMFRSLRIYRNFRNDFLDQIIKILFEFSY
jgi:hypothetical protein